jgi:hypothetical protein
MSSPDNVSYPSQSCRDCFGKTLTSWLERAGWSHDTPLRWGKAAQFPTVADSTFNRMQRGKIAQPYPVTFIQFGMMNDRLASRNYGLAEDDPLLPRIARQRAIEHDDGRLWTATDFFSHFIGELEPPAWAKEQPLPTLQQAVEASAEAVERFRGTAQALNLPLPEAWESLAAVAAKASATVMPHLSNDELETLRMVLSGWHTWTPEQMHQLRDLDGGLRPLSLLDYWKDTIK